MTLNRRQIMFGGAAALSLSACGPRAQFILPQINVPSTRRRILVATNRPSLASRDRTESLRFVALDIDVPTERRAGLVPATGLNAFGLLDQSPIANAAALGRAMGPAGQHPLIVWVHGFNNTPAEAVYRQAQMANDAGLQGPQLSFVWPSDETARGYLYDRDSALQARGPLADLLEALPRIWSGEIVVIAHSLGGLLVMETLKRLSLQGRPLRLDGLVLLQPDVAPDVFKSQVSAIGPLPENAILVTSRDDPALFLSARAAQSEERVGATDDPTDYEAMGFQVLDLTEVEDAANPHLVALTSPTVLQRIRQINGL